MLVQEEKFAKGFFLSLVRRFVVEILVLLVEMHNSFGREFVFKAWRARLSIMECLLFF